MTKIAYRWFYLHGYQHLEKVHANSDGALTLHGHSQEPHHGMYMRDISLYEMLMWSRQGNVTLIVT